MTAQPARTRRRGSYVTGTAARARILRAATEAFSEHGYRGASLAAIGRSIDMTQQGVLYHFPTKVSLLLAVLEERDRRGMQTWPQDRPLVGIEVLDEWDATVAQNVQRYGLVRLAHVLGAEATEADHPARDYYITHFDIGRGMLRSSFRAGVEAGQLRADLDYEMVADQVIAMSEGLENQWLIDPASIDIVACFHDFTHHLRARIRREP
ncbi:MAG TPA: TetR/AcrR family transcriptional regulator [Jiangellaceae bacterium]|nr:TetR/AcrR family transcriptional regulator [Jiangellaceae bacterium]